MSETGNTNPLGATVPKLEYVPAILAAMIVIGFFLVLYLLMFHEIPKDNLNTVNLILGAVGGSVTTIVAFYFGSSKSGQAKDAVINAVVDKSTKGP